MAVYKKIPLKPFPNGWYVVALSEELKQGEIITRQFVGKEIVIYRTESGKAVVAEAYCPHMGGHFGYGGTVEGETIKCPFHHFCFNHEGNCTKTGYDSKPSSKLKLPIFPSDEKNNLILAWFDEKGNAPSFETPTIAMNGWTDFLFAEYDLNSHPQETSENSVDIGHFGIVHGYKDVATISEMSHNGPYLQAKYGMTRIGDFLFKQTDIRTEFNVHVHGLGYSFVQTMVSPFEIETRHLVLSTPTAAGKIKLRIGAAIKNIAHPSKITPLLSLLPKPLVTKIIHKNTFKGYCHDVSQDFKIWQNKIYIDPPLLAKGDGPVAQYRMYAHQFYYEDSLQPDLYPNALAAKQ
ncbi:MAG: Rieske (2Fe-2S) protein [Chitinophagales bacterium]|nr:Rieske (2Fe-2S) protein [Chitinophagales bacterium]